MTGNILDTLVNIFYTTLMSHHLLVITLSSEHLQYTINKRVPFKVITYVILQEINICMKIM